ncbi:hypothetical protein BDV12DRAFT_128900 [Aspergillus spectabilis]
MSFPFFIALLFTFQLMCLALFTITSSQTLKFLNILFSCFTPPNNVRKPESCSLL